MHGFYVCMLTKMYQTVDHRQPTIISTVAIMTFRDEPFVMKVSLFSARNPFCTFPTRIKVPSSSDNSLSDTHLVQQTGKLCNASNQVQLLIKSKQECIKQLRSSSGILLCVVKQRFILFVHLYREKNTGITFKIHILNNMKYQQCFQELHFFFKNKQNC